MVNWIADESIALREVNGTRSERHNSISGVPTFSVQLEVPNQSLEVAISKLLGTPEVWPHETVFNEVRAFDVSLVADRGKYSTDADAELLYAVNPHLINVQYGARHGFYHTALTEDDEDLYIDDSVDPRVESLPMDFNQLIWGTTDPDEVPNQKQTIQAGVVPSRYENGEQLIHYIEGWTTSTSAISGAIGTVNNAAYTSLPLNRTFAIGTLLLRNAIITKGMTFKSYRQPPAPLSGYPTYMIKCIYEYKNIGWDVFWRIFSDGTTDLTNYYYIRQKTSPHARVEPFPQADHSDWLF